MEYQPFLFICESPVHVGTGTETSDYIDNRIQRDVVTEYPKIEGSGFRGALREAFERRLGANKPFIRTAFGPAPEDTEQQKGALKLSSLQLLLFPVASPKGTNAWVTCQRALESFRMEFIQRGQSITYEKLTNPFHEKALVVGGTNNTGLAIGQQIVLSQHTYEIQRLEVTVRAGQAEAKPLSNWLADKLFPQNSFFKQELQQKIVVVNNDVFKYLVKFHTDVHTGNRINHKTGVVDEGKLFTTEYLPHFSVLYGWAETWPEFTDSDPKTAQEVMTTFTDTLQNQLNYYLQVGGKASIGKGMGRLVLLT